MVTYHELAKIITDIIDDLEETGYELHLEKTAYPESEYKVLQSNISKEINDYVECLHMIIRNAKRYHNIRIGDMQIAYLEETLTSSPNYGKCKICKFDMNHHFHHNGTNAYSYD